MFSGGGWAGRAEAVSSPWPGWILSDSFVSFRNQREKIQRNQTKTNPNFALCIFNLLSLKTPNEDVRGSGFLVAAPAGPHGWVSSETRDGASSVLGTCGGDRDRQMGQ